MIRLYIENTYGWLEKNYLGIGRCYNMEGDLDSIHIDFLIWRLILDW